MKILAIDTSSKVFCLGVCTAAAQYEYALEASTRLSRLLVPTLDRVFKALALTPQDIDCFACGMGPGSFTGVRVGMAAAKAMAWSTGKPLAGVVSLDVLARAVEIDEGFIVPAIDAKRGLLYSCVYQRRNKRLRRLTPYLLSGCADLVLTIKRTVKVRGLAQTWMLGDGLTQHRETLCRAMPSLQIADKDYWQLSPKHLLDRARELIQERAASDAFRLRPLYLYPKECQIRQAHTPLWPTRRKK